MNASCFTPTERAMLEVLRDGQPHPAAELHACLPDQLGPVSNIHHHLRALRRILRQHGQDIICQRIKPQKGQRRLQYRWVRLIGKPEDGPGP